MWGGLFRVLKTKIHLFTKTLYHNHPSRLHILFREKYHDMDTGFDKPKIIIFIFTFMAEKITHQPLNNWYWDVLTVIFLWKWIVSDWVGYELGKSVFLFIV